MYHTNSNVTNHTNNNSNDINNYNHNDISHNTNYINNNIINTITTPGVPRGFLCGVQVPELPPPTPCFENCR